MVLFMVLASSREAGAPDEVYHRVIMGALQAWYWCDLRRQSPGGMMSRALLNIMDMQVRSSGMCNHIGACYLCLANSMIKLYSFLIQNTHFGAEVY